MKLRRLGLLLVILPLVLLAGLAPGARAATLEDLYGRWSGTWFVDEWFYAPTGQPIADAAPVNATFDLTLHAFDGSNFGQIALYANLDIVDRGTVEAVMVTGNAVSIAIAYPDLMLGYPSATMTGTLVGHAIGGDFADELVPIVGLIGWRGPFVMTAEGTSPVPEPASSALLLAGLALVAARRQARRARAAQLPR